MINKVKINPIDRINRIAMTGDIEDPKPLSPVDNIMQHYPKAQETPQEEGGFWNGLKNFAGSKGGRMLIGGLGTAAAVGLTGGGLQNALGYGVIGAGKTAENIYNQEQDQKAWEEKEAERLFRQQESEANRQHDWDIAKAKIKADREARKDEMDRVLKTLELKNEYGAFDKKGDSLSGVTEFVDYMGKNYGWTPEQSLNYYGKMTPEEQLAFHEKKGAIDTENKITIANNEFGNKSALQDDAQAYGFEMEDKKHGNKLEAMGADYGYKSKLQSQKDEAKEKQSQRDFERSLVKSEFDNELKKGFEAYKTTLPVQKVIELEQKAALMNQGGFNVTASDLAMEDYLNDVASRDKTVSQTNLNNVNAGFISGAKTNLTNAQAGLTNARTGLTEAQTTKLSKEIENFGKTSAIWAAEWLANNPNATLEQKAAMGAVGNMSKEVAGFVALGMPEQEAFNLVTSLLKKQLAEANIWTDASSQTAGQVGGTAPVYPAEDGEEIDASSLY